MIIAFLILFFVTNELVCVTSMYNRQMGINPWPFASSLNRTVLYIISAICCVWYLGWLWGTITFVAYLFAIPHFALGWVLSLPPAFIKDPQKQENYCVGIISFLLPVSIGMIVFCIVSFFVVPFEGLKEAILENKSPFLCLAEVAAIGCVVCFFVAKISDKKMKQQGEISTSDEKSIPQPEKRPQNTKNIKDDSDTPFKAREYINALKSDDDWNDPTDEFNNIISDLIHNENIHRKTELLIDALDNINDLFNQAKRTPGFNVGSANLTAVIHLRIYLDCILVHDNDFDTINDLYLLSKITGSVRESAHKYIHLMIKISDLLDRAIVYLFENYGTVSTDYYPIVEKKIRGYLNEYIDDDTGWNKI